MNFTKVLIAFCTAGLLCLQNGLAQTAPQTGWWYNPSQGGRGFAIEVQGDKLFLGAYMYEAIGRATWYASGNVTQPNWTYLGSLQSYANGQTLSGAYRPNAIMNANAGDISILFTDASHGTLIWPGGSTPIQRFSFGSGTPTATPQTGWWWNEAEPGRGFFIEIQGTKNLLFMAGYMYDTSGNPVWYAAEGAMTSPTLFKGYWNQYSGGQTMTGPYQPPNSPFNAGSLTLEFTSTSTALMTLPGNRQVALTRFNLINPSDGVLTGNSADQAKFIAARGYPHIFSLGLITEDVIEGVIVPMTPARRLETWVYNDANVTSAVFDNGFFISQETLGSHSNFRSTNLKPEMFRQGMTEAQIIAAAGLPTCVDSALIAGKTMRILRYASTIDSPVASIGLINGELVSVSAGFLVGDRSNPGTNLCSTSF